MVGIFLYDILLILGCLALISIVIVIKAYIAGCFADIASEKGFDEGKYFWIPFLLGIVGYLMVIALPDRGITIELNSNSKARSQEDAENL